MVSRIEFNSKKKKKTKKGAFYFDYHSWFWHCLKSCRCQHRTKTNK